HGELRGGGQARDGDRRESPRRGAVAELAVGVEPPAARRAVAEQRARGRPVGRDLGHAAEPRDGHGREPGGGGAVAELTVVVAARGAGGRGGQPRAGGDRGGGGVGPGGRAGGGPGGGAPRGGAAAGPAVAVVAPALRRPAGADGARGARAGREVGRPAA